MLPPKLDTPEALVAEARSGLDTERFRGSLELTAIMEAFGADPEETRAVGVELPFFRFGEGVIAAAALAAGGSPAEQALPDPLTAVTRVGHLATAEVATLCDLPLTGTLWEPA